MLLDLLHARRAVHDLDGTIRYTGIQTNSPTQLLITVLNLNKTISIYIS